MSRQRQTTTRPKSNFTIYMVWSTKLAEFTVEEQDDCLLDLGAKGGWEPTPTAYEGNADPRHNSQWFN